MFWSIALLREFMGLEGFTLGYITSTPHALGFGNTLVLVCVFGAPRLSGVFL